jgi:hypothetical protein
LRSRRTSASIAEARQRRVVAVVDRAADTAE